ncbi:MAG TPA: GNAT family N-acetyltransferase [Vicinamibacterales bacterium]|nr:GNAT family N-acetyltransferase [Vicinamibacterales bacterium]
MVIRPASDRDRDAIWDIFSAVVAGRDTYAFAPDTPRDVGINYWFGPDIAAFVAELDGRVVGMYKLIANVRDLGAHVSNASFMVHSEAVGKGVGRAMGLHALREARAHGYTAMQFNFVVRTNRRAVALWQSLGFQIVGTLPKAFRHGSRGLVDAYVMHRFLDDIVLTFGTPTTDAHTTVRPSAYAVIANAQREIAVVTSDEAILLPGGEIDADETSDTALVREVQEECALHVRVVTNLGDAIQFVHSARNAAHYEKRSNFVGAEVLGASAGPPEHVTRWLSPPDALGAVTYESHAWAIRRWARLSS